jgi:hypothetical protein
MQNYKGNNMNTKEFGIFVGLFNKVNDSKISVKNALKNKEMVELYESVQVSVKKDVKINTTSTKRRSLEQTDLPKTRAEVYDYIKKNPSKTRWGISVGMDRRINIICGRVNELIESGLVYVDGEAIDLNTGRKVETISAAERN